MAVKMGQEYALAVAADAAGSGERPPAVRDDETV
jgi:hypothetical protein